MFESADDEDLEDIDEVSSSWDKEDSHVLFMWESVEWVEVLTDPDLDEDVSLWYLSMDEEDLEEIEVVDVLLW